MKYQKIIKFINNIIAEAVAKSYETRITTKNSKNLGQNNLEPVKNKNNKEIPKERYISPGEKNYR